MRRILFVLLFFINPLTKLFAGDTIVSDSLPDANKKILNYAVSQLGKKVGTGICFDLVDKSLCQVDPLWKKRRNKGKHKDEFVYGKKIDINEVLPGDIVTYDWRLGNQHASHAAIIYSISTEGIIQVLEQNCDGNINKSTVQINPLVFDPDMIVKHLTYFRPY